MGGRPGGALRSYQNGGNAPVDWANLIEEVEGLAGADRRELWNRLRVVIVHLLKLRHSSAQGPRPGWRETVREQRARLETLLNENRSMRATVGAAIAEVMPRALRDATGALAD